jgi:hypothetical protein
MNLVQIQERLKDMPTQAIMSYANGMNPEVPPYLALGELNRRKQMEQKAVQAPTGTVKDNIEQQMANMQMQAAKQRQMAQQMAQQGAQAQMPVPPGVPEPQMQAMPEDSGVATLPTGEMNFGSGGIVAFANKEGKQLVEDDEDRAMKDLQTEIEYRERDARQKRLEADRAKNMAIVNQTSERPVMQNDPRLVGTTPPAETLGTLPPPPRNVPPGGIANVVPPKVMQQNVPPPPPPQAPQPPQPQQPAAPASPLLDMLKTRIAETAPALPDYETERAAAAVKNPLLNMQQGKKIEEGIAGLRAGYGKQQEAFDKNEEAAARAALWQGLIEGGESTRGIRGKGLAGLGTGAGKSFLASMAGARSREMAQQELVTQRNFNLTKMENELESARIAEAKGDFNTAYGHKMKAAEFKQNAVKDQNQLISQGAQVESADNREMMRLRNEKELADIRSRNDRELAQLKFKYEKELKGIPQAQRASFEEQFVAEAVKAGIPRLDAMREAKNLGKPRDQLTYAQAADDVDNFLKSTQGMTYIAVLNKAAKEKKEPMLDSFTIRKNLIEQQMQQSGSSNAPKAKNNDLLKAADAIVGAK